MSFKKNLNKTFGDSDTLILLRYESSKSLFIYSVLIFFLNYLFVGAEFYLDFFLKTLPFTYFLFLVSFCIFVFLFINNTFKLNSINKILVFLLSLIFFVIFMVPILGIDFLDLLNI